MERRTEAQVWHVVGGVVGVAGAAMVGYAFAAYGLAPLTVRALELALAGSFAILSGTAAFLTGRALHVKETVLTRLEAILWLTLAAVCIMGGGVIVAIAKLHQGVFAADRLAMGLAGAFTIMFGVLCLLGERVMARMHDALVQEPEQKARAAAGGK